MTWEIVFQTQDQLNTLYRSKVTNGWILWMVGNGGGITFLDDPHHAWDGQSQP